MLHLIAIALAPAHSTTVTAFDTLHIPRSTPSHTAPDELADALDALARVDAACAAQLKRLDRAWAMIEAKGRKRA
jgi:hypothetical protein